MKERFLLAVSWGAFLNFVVLWGVVLVALMKSASAVDSAAQIFTSGLFWMWLAPSLAVWLVLWIVTGSPRILPWRK